MPKCLDGAVELIAIGQDSKEVTAQSEREQQVLAFLFLSRERYDGSVAAMCVDDVVMGDPSLKCGSDEQSCVTSICSFKLPCSSYRLRLAEDLYHRF